MKYMLLIYEHAGVREAFQADEKARAEMNALMAEVEQAGELVGGEALADPSQSKAVRVKDGAPAVTDGPFIESKEYLGGYVIVETETEARAVEIAGRLAGQVSVEVRPLMDGAGEEM